MSDLNGFDDVAARVRQGMTDVHYDRPLSSITDRNHPRSTGRRSGTIAWVRESRGLVMAVTFVAVIAAIAPVAFLMGRDTGVSDEPSATGRDSAVPAAVLGSGELAWRQTSFDPAPASIEWLVEGPGGLMALGQEDQHMRLWLSVDTEDWVEQSPDVFKVDASVSAVSAGSFGYLAGGIHIEKNAAPVVWFSPDGLSWIETLLPLPADEDQLGDVVSYFVDATAANDRMMMVAGEEIDETSGEPDTPTITESMLREAGAPVADAPGAIWFSGGSGGDLAVQLLDANREVIWEATFNDLGIDPAETQTILESRPVLWLSSDGSEWELIEFDGWVGASSVGPVTANDTGFLAAINQPGQGTQLWATSNGQEWQETYQFANDQFVTDLAAGPDGYVAITRSRSDSDLGASSIWFSPDGRQWTLTGSYDAPRLVGSLAANATSGFAYAVYATPDSPGETGASNLTIMTSSDGINWTPASPDGVFGDGLAINTLHIGETAIYVAGFRLTSSDPFAVVDAPYETWVGIPK